MRCDPAEFVELARRIISPPTAPYHEQFVRNVVRAIASKHGLQVREDEFGNLYLSYTSNADLRPVILAAHMDHPGFEITSSIGPDQFAANFIGGVAPQYFKTGTAVRLWPGGTEARIAQKLAGGKEYLLQTAGPKQAQAPVFATWDLPDFEFTEGQIRARACDDLAGVSAAVMTLLQLKRHACAANATALISRAEEAGFHGALAACTTNQIPRDALVISLEASREMPPVKIGGGVILRVGDLASTFDSAANRYLREVALALQKEHSDFQFQRALMSGGTCEATAYQEFGYTVAAVCVPLGNYHNCGPNEEIAPEYVSASDTCGMVDVLTAACARVHEYRDLTGKLRRRLDESTRVATALLKPI